MHFKEAMSQFGLQLKSNRQSNLHVGLMSASVCWAFAWYNTQSEGESLGYRNSSTYPDKKYKSPDPQPALLQSP